MIGRKDEIAELMELYHEKRPHLVAIYGRRRVGKTYLVEQTFKNMIISLPTHLVIQIFF